MTKTIDQALNLHQKGQVHEALALYQECLDAYPDDQIAQYGVASILLSQGQIAGYEFAEKAIFKPQTSNIDKLRAADSIVRLLIQHQYQDHAKRFLLACQEHSIKLADFSELWQLVELPEYLESSAYDHELQKNLERYRPIENKHYVYAIDIVGGCNLRCPTCPVSNSANMPKGLMSLDLYKNILEKIKRESIDTKPDIWLFNWTEPMLHPEVDRFIHLTHHYGLTSFISTNLNIGERIDAVMQANPTRLKVSLSSFEQAIYSQTHTRGDIEQVIQNLQKLAKARDKHKCQTQIWIGHHLYKNTLEEQSRIQTLAHELGFMYAASPAILAPIEAVFKLMNNQATDDVHKIRPNFLYDPLHIREEMSRKRSGTKDCELRFNMMAIQHDGQVNLCCATVQGLNGGGVSFLKHSHKEIEDMKYRSKFCQKCMAANLHLTISDV